MTMAATTVTNVGRSVGVTPKSRPARSRVGQAAAITPTRMPAAASCRPYAEHHRHDVARTGAEREPDANSRVRWLVEQLSTP